MLTFKPGDEVLAFDTALFEDDVTTPFTETVKPAIVTRVYHDITDGIPFVDLKFLHRMGVSHAHFAMELERDQPRFRAALAKAGLSSA